jgi:hypothetical protein
MLIFDGSEESTGINDAFFEIIKKFN